MEISELTSSFSAPIQKGWYDSEQDPSFDSNDFDEINDILDNSDGGEIDDEENGNWKKKVSVIF